MQRPVTWRGCWAFCIFLKRSDIRGDERVWRFRQRWKRSLPRRCWRRSSKEDRVRAGLPVTNSILPYGYRWGEKQLVLVGDEDRLGSIPEPDPQTAESVRLMFEWFLDGYLPSQIVGRLAEMGPLGLKGRPLSNETVRDILNNPFYAGYIRYLGNVTDERGHRKHLRYTGTLYPGLHGALITLDKWDGVQKERFLRASARRTSVSRPHYTIVSRQPGRRYFVEKGRVR